MVDIETTGLRLDRDEILQIGVVLLDWPVEPGIDISLSSSGSSDWSSYVRPRQWLTRDLGPFDVHGINRRKLIRARSAARALKIFAQITAGRIVVAHNADFDTTFLRAAAARHHVDLEWDGVLCTLKMSRKLDPERQLTHKLSTLCEKYGVTLEQAHDALHDARATAEILPHLITAHGVRDAAALQPFVRR